MTFATTQPDAIILAAGKGTRMGSDKAKVLHEVDGKPMLWWVVKACKDAGVERCIIVVGFQASAVRQVLDNEVGIEFVQQNQQLGTAHAVQMAKPLFENSAKDVFVLAGDGPLIRVNTLKTLLDAHRAEKACATVATSNLQDPTGYGRVVRDKDGGFKKIVEQKDARAAELAIKEINPSYYCFNSQALFYGLSKVSSATNKQNEYYLTDVPQILKNEGKKVSIVDAVSPEDVLSINTPEQLAKVDEILNQRNKKKSLALVEGK